MSGRRLVVVEAVCAGGLPSDREIREEGRSRKSWVCELQVRPAPAGSRSCISKLLDWALMLVVGEESYEDERVGREERRGGEEREPRRLDDLASSLQGLARPIERSSDAQEQRMVEREERASFAVIFEQRRETRHPTELRMCGHVERVQAAVGALASPANWKGSGVDDGGPARLASCASSPRPRRLHR